MLAVGGEEVGLGSAGAAVSPPPPITAAEVNGACLMLLFYVGHSPQRRQGVPGLCAAFPFAAAQRPGGGGACGVRSW